MLELPDIVTERIYIPKPPQFRAGDEFDRMSDYVADIAQAYMAYVGELTSAEVETAHVPSSPEQYGASERVYTLKWQTDLARAVGDCFGLVISVPDDSPYPAFRGEQVGAHLASQLFSYIISQIDKYTPGEYVRRWKRASYHDEPLEQVYGWRKDFIYQGVKRLQEVRRAFERHPRSSKLLEDLEKVRDARHDGETVEV